MTALLLLLLNVADPLPDAFWCDTINDQIVRFADLNGDRDYLDFREATAFWRQPGASPRDVQARFEDGRTVVYWVDTVLDVVFRGVDEDGDGVLDPDEARPFRSAKELDGSSGPDGIELTDDGAVWWTSDCCQHEGLFRLRDENGDGDADDAGEQRVLVDGQTVAIGEDDGEPVTLGAGSLRRLAPAGNGVLAYAADDDALWRFEDLDDDGDVTGSGESVLFLNPSGKRAELTRSPDFASGSLRELRTKTDTSAGEPTFARLAFLTSMVEDGSLVVYLGTDVAAADYDYSSNAAGEGLNGLIFRAEDRNGDRDANDPGEVELFYDGSKTSWGPYQVQIGGVLGLDAWNGSLFVADIGSSRRQIHELRDVTGNHRIEPGYELREGLFDLSLWGEKEPFPTAHTWVHDLGVVGPGGLASPTFDIVGDGCSFIPEQPRISGEGLAHLDSTAFTCHLSEAGPGRPAFLWMGTDSEQWLWNAPLPYPLDDWGLPGCWLRTNLDRVYAVVTDAEGAASVTPEVPDAPKLLGLVVPMQWVVLEPSTGFVAITAGGMTELVP